MPPIGSAKVAVVFLGQGSGSRCAQSPRKNPRVLEPRLEIPRRGLDNQRWLKSLCFHALDRCGREVINQAQIVFASWPDINVSPIAILEPQPWDRLQDSPHIPGSRNHRRFIVASALGLVQPDLEYVAARRDNLSSDRFVGSVHVSAPAFLWCRQTPLLRKPLVPAPVTPRGFAAREFGNNVKLGVCNFSTVPISESFCELAQHSVKPSVTLRGLKNIRCRWRV